MHETMVFEHIAQHGGDLYIALCAKELGISKGDVERAVKSLKKGKLEAE